MTDTRIGCILCLGFFDGVHLGHRALIREACELKKEYGLPVIVHTFLTPPAALITGTPVMCLTDNRRKEQLLLSCGADRVIFSEFDERIRDLPGSVYFEKELLQKMNCSWIVAGTDHRFGKNGDTGAEELKALCREHGVGLRLIPPVCAGGGRVSSSAIRRAIMEADYPQAEKMLGRKIDLTDPEHPYL